MAILWSEKAVLKLLGAMFRPVSKRPWYIVWFMKLIKSKEGKKEFLHKWTNKQYNEYKNDHTSKTWLLSRCFLTGSYADRMMRIEIWATAHLTYISDRGENWQTAEETLIRGAGDCEDQNNLIQQVALLAGVPDYLLWNVLGPTATAYHMYLLYFYTPKGKMIPIDSTYYVETGKMADQKPFRINSKKYGPPDFVWNKNHTFKWKPQ